MKTEKPVTISPDEINLDELLTTKEAAVILHRSHVAMTCDRMNGKGLPFIKLGRKVYYRKADIREHLASGYVHRAKAA